MSDENESKTISAIATPEDLALAREVTAIQKSLAAPIAEAGRKLDKLEVLEAVDKGFEFIIAALRAGDVQETAIRAIHPMWKRCRSLVERFILTGAA